MGHFNKACWFICCITWNNTYKKTPETFLLCQRLTCCAGRPSHKHSPGAFHSRGVMNTTQAVFVYCLLSVCLVFLILPQNAPTPQISKRADASETSLTGSRSGSPPPLLSSRSVWVTGVQQRTVGMKSVHAYSSRLLQFSSGLLWLKECLINCKNEVLVQISAEISTS